MKTPVSRLPLEGVLKQYPKGAPVALARDLYFDDGHGRAQQRQGKRGVIKAVRIVSDGRNRWVDVTVQFAGATKEVDMAAGYLASLLGASS